MSDFYKQALKKQDKLTAEKYRELLVSASQELNRMEAVLDSVTDGILVCDGNHSLVLVNKSAQRLLPMNHTEGVPVWTAVRDERITEFFRKTLLDSDRVQDREIDIALQGQNRLLSISILPLVSRHRIAGSLIYIEDITEKRGRESRLRRAENLASLTTLAAGVAHEIKNPLGSISIHLQLMQKTLSKISEESAKPLRKYIDVLNEEVDRLNHIVVDFLFAVRPMSLELREGDINALIRELVEFVSYEMEQSHVKCLLELDEKLPPVLMDERYMKQVLLNLIKNAQGAMQNGGILTIASACADNEVRINIIDTGSGISEENLSKIFEPYFTTKETGSGLGLTLVFKIIKEHRGEISVESKEGAGTCFEISLPVVSKERRMIAYNGGSEKSAGVKA
jgi:PAS domain S-box-containing protein